MAGRAVGLPLEERVLEHIHAVVVQIGVLLSREVANAHAGIDSPRIQKLVSDLRDDDQFLAAGEGEVALVEQVIDVRRQQQAVGTVEALGIGGVPPWLDVTRLQMPRLVHSGDPAELFPQQNLGPEHPLATPGSDKLIPERRPRDATVGNRVFEVDRLRRALKNGERGIRVPVRLSDETDEGIGECPWDLSEVDGLQAVPALLKR